MSYVSDVEFYLKLQKTQFKTPIEAVKRNFKAIQKLIEKQSALLSRHLIQLKELELNGQLSKEIQRERIAVLINIQTRFHDKLVTRVEEHNDYVQRLEIRLQRFKGLEKILEKGKNSSSDFGDDFLAWTRDQINLLIGCYLMKNLINFNGDISQNNPGLELLKHLKLDKLIDHDVILKGISIYQKIRYEKDLSVLIDWCNENKKVLKSMKTSSTSVDDSNTTQKDQYRTSLDFETFYQNFIELIKEDKIYEALIIAKEHLMPQAGPEVPSTSNSATTSSATSYSDKTPKYDSTFEKFKKSAGLLVFGSLDIDELFGLSGSKVNSSRKDSLTNSAMSVYDTFSNSYNQINDNLKPFKELLNDEKWIQLADFFIYNYNHIYGIDQSLELIVMLSVGITSLKTHSCNGFKNYSKHDFQDPQVTFQDVLHNIEESNDISNAKSELSINDLNKCPICSLELYEIAQHLPFSHQTKSNIYENPVKLPNGHIYQLEKLLKMNEAFEKPEIENLDEMYIKDPLTNEMFKRSELQKIFPT
ncbi:hypothetical protein LJB42_003293 [Komagataella kurtzmanii]|nr:hypothetical protein LJB42_003293 [Komagataella kurtzmanii]